MSKSESLPKRMGRPPSEQAQSHGEILQAVFDLLQEKSVRDLTIEAVAKRAGVGKPTIYRWWPTRAALLWAMFYERTVRDDDLPSDGTVEEHMRARLHRLVNGFGGMFGKLVSNMIGEAQSDPELLEELRAHKEKLREATFEAIERGKACGEFKADTDTELVLDLLYAPLYYRLVMGARPIPIAYADRLADNVFGNIRMPKTKGRVRTVAH